MILLKGSSLEEFSGLKVFVYFNLHKKVFSIKALEGAYKGLVIAHSETVLLSEAVTKVSQAGRKRVLAEKAKNVHAGITGSLLLNQEVSTEGRELTYNPYKYSSFVYKDNKEPATKEPRKYLLKNKSVTEVQ